MFLTNMIDDNNDNTIIAIINDNNNSHDNNNNDSNTDSNNFIYNIIYYIQTMKRLPCLICSVNITLIKTKRISNLWYQYNSFCFKDFYFSMVYYCDVPVTNLVML